MAVVTPDPHPSRLGHRVAERVAERVTQWWARFRVVLLTAMPELASWQLAHPWQALRADAARYGVRGARAVLTVLAGLAALLVVGTAVGGAAGLAGAWVLEAMLDVVRGH